MQGTRAAEGTPPLARARHPVRNVVLIAVVAAIILAGTYAIVVTRPAGSHSGISVVATFYPVYEFARNIAGARVNVTLLVPATLDVHSFDPMPSSVQAVADANVLIYGGAGLEPWIPSLVAAAGNPNLILVDSSAGIPLLPVSPEFQRGNRTVDPHLWLDPVLAKRQVANILAGLIKADPADSAYFSANAQAYDAKLDHLNSEAADLTAHTATRVFVTFHEAFAYFAARYNVTQIPIAGPFEEDPTPTDIQNVINATQTYHLCYIGYESLSSPAIAQSVATQTNASLLLLDPIEGISPSDQSQGKTYLVKMQDNLDNFALALNHVGCS